MADIFISYTRLDQDRVRQIAERLTSLGYSIWWDKHERAGGARAGEIERELDGARAVLTAWSHHARVSSWVHAEASRALDAGKLLQLRLDNVQLPPPFDVLHCADMSGERGEWGPLEAAMQSLVRQGQPPPEAPAQAPGMLATAAAAGAPKLLFTATLAALLAYAGAVPATYNGLMTPDQLQIALTGMLGVGGVCAALSAHRLFTVLRAGG